MNRRTLLKRVGAAVGGTAVVGGTASAERERVTIDGEEYLVRSDVDVESLDPEAIEGDRIDSQVCGGICYYFCSVCYA